MRGALVLAIVAASLLAGCALDEAPTARDAPPPSEPRAYAVSTPEFAFPASVVPPSLAVRVAVENAWARPLEAVTLHAQPAALSTAWFVGRPVGHAHVTYIDDAPYLTNADAPRSHGASGPRVREGPTATRARIDTGDIAPGGEPRALAFPAEGRYRLALADGAEMNATVAREAASGPAYVRVAATGFEPREVDVRPDEPLIFLNARPAPARVGLVETLVRLDPAAADLRFLPVDEGAYDVALVARENGAVGVATARVVADLERPPARETDGPYGGTFLCGGAPACDASRSYDVDAKFPMKELRVNFSIGSPAGTALLVRVVHAGTTLASGAYASDGALTVADVPAGRTSVEVESAPGALVSYSLSLEIQYRLPPPPPG